MGALLDARGIEHTEPDTPTYVAPAVSLSEGAGFTTVAADGTRHPEFLRTPVYPLYLAARVGMQALRHDPLSYARDAVFHMFNIVMAPADAQTVGRVLFGWDRAIATPLVRAIHERTWSGAGLPRASACGVPAEGPPEAVTSILISTYGRFLLPVLPSVAHFLTQDPEGAA